MARLQWGAAGTRVYEAGVDRGVLFVDEQPGVAWTGLTSVEQSPSGGDPKEYYIDGVKYLNLSSAEQFVATVNAYTYPDEFAQCDGSAQVRTGMFLTQQRRKSFGLSYRTIVGNDLEGADYGYKIHIVYNALAAPSQRSYATVGDSIDPTDFSWNLTTRPPVIPGYRRTAHVELDSRTTPPLVLESIEKVLYGDETNTSRLPSISELLVMYDELQGLEVFDNGDGTFTITGPDSIVFALDTDVFQISHSTVVAIDEFTYFIGSDAASAPSVFAGTAASTSASGTFNRTATENANGASITSRSWKIISGPMGSGTTIGTLAALAWIPGSSPVGTTDIRQPVCQEMAFELTSTAENSTKDWTTAYNYIEDILDDRGYTAGIVGFVSASGDMLQVVEQYIAEAPGNVLSSYVPGLEACVAVGYGPGASAAAASNLGAPFIADWIDAADNDPIFRKIQRDFRKSMYWDDCLVQALADGVGPLGLAIHYDILVNHGVGTDPQSYGGIIAAARASASKPPSDGGTEAGYLTKLCDLRDAVLVDWGDYQPDGRSSIFRPLITAGKFDLLGIISWSVYGDSFSFNRPDPPVDARLGSYMLRYSATNYIGTSTSDVTITAV